MKEQTLPQVSGALPLLASLSPSLNLLEREVAGRFGLVPNLWRVNSSSIATLWAFSVSAYIDNPLPSVFKERLFVYLSQLCESPYCIVRHCAFLLGHGYAAGDSTASPQTAEQAISLLRRSAPGDICADNVGAALDLLPSRTDLLEDAATEEVLFEAAALIFSGVPNIFRVIARLRAVLGVPGYENMLALLTYIRAEHFWTRMHPELAWEEDAQKLLASNEILRHQLLDCSDGTKIQLQVKSLDKLSAADERQRREAIEATRAIIEHEVKFVLQEANHRIKNSLQIVSSILHLQAAHSLNGEVTRALHDAGTRVLAIAGVHETLNLGSGRVVSLAPFLTTLCRKIAQALGRDQNVELDITSVDVSADEAVPLALILNELLTNAIKYGKGPYLVRMSLDGDRLALSVRDCGDGPQVDGAREGLGTRIIKSCLRQLDGQMEAMQRVGSFSVKLTIPLRA